MAMITTYFEKTVLGTMYGRKRGIEMGVWSKTDEFHNARNAAKFVPLTK
jgi:hypothetical protein